MTAATFLRRFWPALVVLAVILGGLAYCASEPVGTPETNPLGQ